MRSILLIVLITGLFGCKKKPALVGASAPSIQAVNVKPALDALPLAPETGTRLFKLSRLDLTLISEQTLLPLLLLGDPGKTDTMPHTVDMPHCQVSGTLLHIPLQDAFRRVSEGKRHGASVGFIWEETLQGSQQVQLPVGTAGALACTPGWGVQVGTAVESTASFIRTQMLQTQKGTEESYRHKTRMQGTYRQTGSTDSYIIQLTATSTHMLQRNRVQETFSTTLTTQVPISVKSGTEAYLIQEGSLMQTTDHHEKVSVTFQQVHYPSLFACRPDAGTVTGQFIDDQQQVRNFSVVFSGEKAGLLSFAEGEISAMELPFRCR